MGAMKLNVEATGRDRLMNVSRRYRFRMLLLFGLAALAGCSNASRVASENDRLRREVFDLESQRDALTLRIRELEAAVASASAASAGASHDPAMTEQVRLATPHVASISIGSLSHAVDGDGDGRADTIVLYVTSRDSLGRFTQMTGHVTYAATSLPTEGPTPIVLGSRKLDPAEIRDAYRSGFMGTHYTLELPITLPHSVDAPIQPLTGAIVQVVFTDGLTRQSHTADRTISLRLSR